MKLVAYLAFDGNCREAFTFYEQALGGKIVAMMDHSDAPHAGQVPPEMQKRIMHASLEAPGGAMLMGGDAPQGYKKPVGCAVSVHLEDPEEGRRVFTALSDGATVQMPMAETFWSPAFGMLTDRFGVPWMVNTTPKA